MVRNPIWLLTVAFWLGTLCLAIYLRNWLLIPLGIVAIATAYVANRQQQERQQEQQA